MYLRINVRKQTVEFFFLIKFSQSNTCETLNNIPETDKGFLETMCGSLEKTSEKRNKCKTIVCMYTASETKENN